MGKRLVVKTVLICLGIFVILNALAVLYILKQYPIDFEEHISVVVAAVNIDEGTVIEKKHLTTKEIQLSASNNVLIKDISQIIGKKAISDIAKNDYIRSNSLLEKESWFLDDERIIVLPMNMEERLANLIQKGSYVDICLEKGQDYIVETILNKIRVQDVLDETGTPFSSNSAVNSNKAFMKLILDKDERQVIYSAKNRGKLIFELYCDESQK